MGSAAIAIGDAGHDARPGSDQSPVLYLKEIPSRIR